MRATIIFNPVAGQSETLAWELQAAAAVWIEQGGVDGGTVSDAGARRWYTPGADGG